VAFNDSLVMNVNPKGGDLTGIQFMDDKLLLFKENNVFVTAGDGPTDTGDQNNYAIPQLIPSDVGCSYPSSIALTPAGVMFKSKKGIYQIDRGLSVTYIGADVQEYNAQDVVSTVTIQDRNQVVFLTSSGLTLSYDYYFGQWSTFTNHAGLDAATFADTYVYLRSDGHVFQENPSKFLDDTIEYRLRIATAWVKMAGVQGFQRVKRFGVLGEYKSAHILRVKIGYDYESTYPVVVLFNAGNNLDTAYYGSDDFYGDSDFYGGVDDNVYQFRAHLPRQKCNAIRFLFEDVTSGTPGESYSISDLSLEVGIKQGINRLRSAKSVG
jgi:hypothetical protein